MPEGVPGAAVKAQPEDELYGGRERPENEEVLQKGRHPGNQCRMPPEEDKEGQEAAPDDIPPEGSVSPVPPLPDVLVRRGDTVAGAANGLCDLPAGATARGS